MARDAASPPPPAPNPIKKSVIRRIRVGKRPLQGTRELVRIAISRSLGESMIRQPTTPAALQPKPIAMVRHCFPQAQHFLKAQSMLKAALGRYPRSSRSVKSGKKMAMGGSITETIHAVNAVHESLHEPPGGPECQKCVREPSLQGE